MNEKHLYYIWLSAVLPAGSKAAKLLLEEHGDIKKIYSLEKDALSLLPLSSSEVRALCNKSLINAEKYFDYCVANNVGILTYEDPYYPERLKIIDNPPPMLYYKGKVKRLDDYPCITMVGTRSCSERGFRLAYEQGFSAASKGAVVVNGLAKGIDGACMAGALDANGYAIGILGCGIDTVYPYENKDLFERLSATGLVITEFPPFSKPDRLHFPVRNRVMSALSLATVVFEADAQSGALITAKHALVQGRRIFAVPGKPYDKSYEGPLELIKEGASVFTEANDVLSEYSMSFPHRINLANDNKAPTDKLDAYVARYFKKGTDPDEPVNRKQARPFERKTDVAKNAFTESKQEKAAVTPAKPKEEVAESTPEQKAVVGADLSLLSSTEKAIYEILSQNGSMTPDEISSHGIKIDDILSALTLLEIYGNIQSLPGGKYKAV